MIMKMRTTLKIAKITRKNMLKMAMKEKWSRNKWTKWMNTKLQILMMNQLQLGSRLKTSKTHAELLKRIQPFFHFSLTKSFQQMIKACIKILLNLQSTLQGTLLLSGSDHLLTKKISKEVRKTINLDFSLMIIDLETSKRESLMMDGFQEPLQ